MLQACSLVESEESPMFGLCIQLGQLTNSNIFECSKLAGIATFKKFLCMSTPKRLNHDLLYYVPRNMSTKIDNWVHFRFRASLGDYEGEWYRQCHAPSATLKDYSAGARESAAPVPVR